MSSKLLNQEYRLPSFSAGRMCGAEPSTSRTPSDRSDQNLVSKSLVTDCCVLWYLICHKIWLKFIPTAEGFIPSAPSVLLPLFLSISDVLQCALACAGFKHTHSHGSAMRVWLFTSPPFFIVLEGVFFFQTFISMLNLVEIIRYLKTKNSLA